MKLKMRIWVVVLATFFGISQPQAQSMYGDQAKADVKLKYVHSLEEALKQAKEQNKLVFFNCFADWATPCHSMNKVVFSDQEFGDYMNETFVNLILDLSHSENIPIKDKYKVRFFAHYLILDQDGNVVHRIGRGFPLPDFKEKVQRALDPNTSSEGMKKIYAEGNRSASFLRDYFYVMSDAGYSDEAEEARQQYLSKVQKSDMAKSENWGIFLGLVQDNQNEWFSFLKENKDLFIKNNGEKKIKDFAANAYMREVMPFMSSPLGYSDERMAQIKEDLKYFEIEPQSEAYIYYDLARTRCRGTIADFVSMLEQHIDKIHPTFATGIDLSLKDMINVTEEEEKLITNYLASRMESLSGSSKQLYQTAIKEIKRENGIIFEQGEFALALKKAKDENKLIFLDAYTTWCGPCKMMAQQVFTLDTVGNYFNNTFINFKMDMESGEGPQWAKTFNINAYPTFLLINGDGEMVHKVTGAHHANTFMDLISKGNQKETSYTYLKQEYESGNRSPIFIKNYVEGMVAAGELRDAPKFIDNYYENLSDQDRHSSEIWAIVEKYGANINSKMLQGILNNKDLYSQLLDDPSFMPALEKVYVPSLYVYISRGEKDENYQKTKNDLSKISLPENSTLSNLLKVEQYIDNSQYDELVTFYQQEVFNMTDNKGKMNMDLLWKYLFPQVNKQQQNEVLEYLKNQHKLADSRALNSYSGLLNSLL